MNCTSQGTTPQVPRRRTTNRDIFTVILSEATGRPLASVRLMVDALQAMLPPGRTTRLDDEIPEEEAEELLAKLREELPAIRGWLGYGLLASGGVA